eukprot:GHVL01034392.1.p1 GENE.GHVL01034392.1~~GHVL01034392.1.p1  ORF type:complete len:280 (-),score=86.48 GHVL01034392.1:565-1404(-)
MNKIATLSEHENLKKMRENRIKMDEYNRTQDSNISGPRGGLKNSNFGTSSAQIFNGEDLEFKERTNFQKTQQKDWINEQKIESQNEKDRYARENREMDEYEAVSARIRAQKEDEYHRQRRENLKQIANQNAVLDEERKEKEKMDRSAELSQRLVDPIANSAPHGGPHSKTRTGFKGASPDAFDEAQQLQELQIEEKNIKKKFEQKTVEMDDRQNELNGKITVSIENQRRRANLEKMKEIQKLNEKLADSQKKRKDHLDKVVYTNAPGEKYFNSFGTTTR